MLTTTNASEFLADYPLGVRTIALELRGMILAIRPDVREMVDASTGVLGYGFGSAYSDLVCTITPSKTGVKLGLARGTELPDPSGLMKGAGRRHRHVSFALPADLKKQGVKPLLQATLGAGQGRPRSAV